MANHTQQISKNISDLLEKGSKEKAITPQEFEQRFSSGHQIFTKDNVMEFAQDSIAKGMSIDNVTEQVNTLSHVLIKSKAGALSQLFVRENK